MRYVILSALGFVCCLQVYCAMATSDRGFDEHLAICVDRLKVDKDIIDTHFDKAFHLPTGNENLNNVVRCVGTDSGLVDADGKYNEALMKIHIMKNVIPLTGKTGTEAVADKAVEECKHHTNGKDRIINLHNCIIDVIHASV
ncbi:hypothetical protein PPYR_04023 [Photinus pyralis]|uniref:Uncharacterized protein n=1 Tax=Photinus pyralis TaxID=7054 RepID=A0A1Y1KT22_PHOPY|nr:uncharacterized protein LOC116163781 [Photinus pyralis]KAB0801837.1 hypothetical protein PPYR_04023 [Photinus pyralis]